MNSTGISIPRVRGQTLLIVEGNHEKNELFWLLFKCFPEIKIDMNDIWIYGTNIYLLYDDIVNEYGEDWRDEDIDLPFVISKKGNYENLCYKIDFVNIFLVFDYEHHDPRFEEDKILGMQEYFMDSTDVGKLYINYPMIESYQHFNGFPDPLFEELKVPVSLRSGSEYKRLVKDMAVIKSILFSRKVRGILSERFNVDCPVTCERCMEELLDISTAELLEDRIAQVLATYLSGAKLETAKHQFSHLISGLGYVETNMSYWTYMRKLFQKIIIHNICKANKIQGNIYQIDPMNYRQSFGEIEFVEILKEQNRLSMDPQKGFIWVLNTCVFVIAEYNFSIVMS